MKISPVKNRLYMKRYLLALFFIALIYLPCYISNNQLISLTREDGPYEYAGAILFLLTAIAFFVLSAKSKRYLYSADQYPQRKYFLFFAVLFLLAFGEEISWGQRIFNFETPETLKEINMQKEFNIHNIDIFHGKNAAGEEKTGISSLFTLHKMFYMFCLTYLFIIPMLYKNIMIKSFLNRISLPIPGIILGVLFIFNWTFANTLRAVNSDLNGHGIVEIKETVIALILFALPLSFLNFKHVRRNAP